MPTICGNFDFSKPNLKERDIKASSLKYDAKKELFVYFKTYSQKKKTKMQNQHKSIHKE
ncbi:hypothetical protein [Prevotella corporis]|uniref:hypothetical protein n=1 Tax=Prevotella corporis TaxID=28128 RepID=UPI001EE2E09D|nr:hypothetical protein [Prevotella corporis]